jgi:hypothetical protein
LPTSVTIPAGKSSLVYTFSTKPVSTAQTITLTASTGTTSKQATVVVTPAYVLQLSASPNSMAGGNNTTLTVGLYGVAGPSGIVVNLSSSSGDVIVPTSLTVGAGKRTASLLVATKTVSANETIMITATTGTNSAHATLTLTPVSVSKIAVNPTSVTGGASTALAVYLNGPAGSSGESVSLKSSSADAVIPGSILVAGGKTSGVMTMPTKPVSASETVTLTATTGATSVQTTLTITPAYVLTIGVSPASIVGGKTTTLTVSLYGVAGPSGIVVSLSTTSPDAKLPATIKVPAGSRTASITLATNTVSATENITLTALTGSKETSTTLTLTQ